MMNRTRRTARRFFGAITDAVRSVTAPAALVQDKADTLVPDPADTYSAEEMPAVEDIAAAAREYDRSTDLARRADRGKRAAKKVLGRLPAGTYGDWLVERVASNRETADLDAIRATYKALGLGPVPMKRNAPSLKVRRIEAPVAETTVDTAAELVAVAA